MTPVRAQAAKFACPGVLAPPWSFHLGTYFATWHRLGLGQPRAVEPLGADRNPNALKSSCNRMYLCARLDRDGRLMAPRPSPAARLSYRELDPRSEDFLARGPPQPPAAAATPTRPEWELRCDVERVSTRSGFGGQRNSYGLFCVEDHYTK
jgi:hypothetical protein